MSKIEDAIEAAVYIHMGQIDKIGKPYILHPLRVMMKFNDEKHMIIAVLHDIIEDSEYSIDYIKQFDFDQDIIDAIDAITRRKGEDYKAYIGRVSNNKIAKEVKIADLEDNMDKNRLDKIDGETAKRLLSKYIWAISYLTYIKP